MALAPPSKDFAAHQLEYVLIEPLQLVRITRFPDTEPYFGKSKTHRFDDPLQGYGVSYAGDDFLVAFAETILHDIQPIRGRYRVDEEALRIRYAATFRGSKITLANLTGTALKRLGGNNDISSEIPYDTTQLWSRAVYMHPQGVEGIQYISRHVNTQMAFALFDRCQGKFLVHTKTPLLEHPNFSEAIEKFGVDVF